MILYYMFIFLFLKKNDFKYMYYKISTSGHDGLTGTE